MSTEFLNPPELCPTFGWTHVVTATGGKTIYISGLVSNNAKGEVVGIGDLRAQVTQTFDNLKAALAAAGATFKHVVKSNLYVVGLKSEHVPIIREVRARYFDQTNPPCSTLIGVEKLVHPDWLIEIELVAVV
jgi:enamine deaminase RidA (YjgF/YER057c/UK114 family)